MDAIRPVSPSTTTYLTPSGHVVLLDADVVLPGRLSIGSHGYAQLTGVRPGLVVLLHRWLLDILDAGRAVIGDHINGNKLDCRRSNLRVVNASQSSSNVSGRGASQYRGVIRCRDKWQARVKYQGKKHHLGTYDTEEEAAAVSRAWRIANLPGYVDRGAGSA